MRRVLFISEHLNVAGTETFMLNVVRSFNKNEIQFDFLIFRKCNNEYVNELLNYGCKILWMTSRKKSFCKYILGIRSFFKENSTKYNAVHWCGGAISSIAPLWYAYKYKIPVRIVHSHSSSCSGIHTYILHHLFKRLLPCFCTHFFACSSLAAIFFYGNKNAVIIPNSIDLMKYKYNLIQRKEYRSNWGISDDEIVIGHIGRFVEIKNQTFLIDILNYLVNKEEKVKLILIGIGELQDAIKYKVEQLNLTEKVIFLGERSDIPLCLNSMDVFVMPSLYEGLPFVLVEAQAAGLPCIISDTINDDAILTPNTKKHKLVDGVNLWGKTILEYSKLTREDTSKYLKEKGFSIDNMILFLDKIYSNNNQ